MQITFRNDIWFLGYIRFSKVRKNQPPPGTITLDPTIFANFGRRIYFQTGHSGLSCNFGKDNLFWESKPHRLGLERVYRRYLVIYQVIENDILWVCVVCISYYARNEVTSPLYKNCIKVKTDLHLIFHLLRSINISHFGFVSSVSFLWLCLRTLILKMLNLDIFE